MAGQDGPFPASYRSDYRRSGYSCGTFPVRACTLVASWMTLFPFQVDRVVLGPIKFSWTVGTCAISAFDSLHEHTSSLFVSVSSYNLFSSSLANIASPTWKPRTYTCTALQLCEDITNVSQSVCTHQPHLQSLQIKRARASAHVQTSDFSRPWQSFSSLSSLLCI